MKEVEYKEINENVRKYKEPFYIIEEEEQYYKITTGRGQKPTGGYDINVGKVEQEGNKLIITVRYFDPDPDEFVNQMITYPQIAIRINKNNLDVSDNLVFIFKNSSGKVLAERES